MADYGVWCRVSGGVTGTRQAWLKQEGRIAEFLTLADAEDEAARLNQQMNGNPHRTADFRYTAMMFGDEPF